MKMLKNHNFNYVCLKFVLQATKSNKMNFYFGWLIIDEKLILNTEIALPRILE